MNLRLLFLTFFLSLSGILSVKAEDKRPNVIFMLADDLGYGDLSSYNPQSKGAGAQ